MAMLALHAEQSEKEEAQKEQNCVIFAVVYTFILLYLFVHPNDHFKSLKQ